MLLAVVVLSNLVAIYTKAFASSKRIIELFNLKENKQTGTLKEFKLNNYIL